LHGGSTAFEARGYRRGDLRRGIDDGHAGLLVPPASPSELSAALVSLIQSPELRLHLGARLLDRVTRVYSASSAMRQICQVYETVLSPRAQGNQAHLAATT